MSIIPLSVPSSSGNTLQRRQTWGTTAASSCFQSPLHRGILFNVCSHPKSCFGEFLSVPSSSGNTLQPMCSVKNIGPLPDFQSPLHRGILFNLMLTPFKQVKHHFQSPLHRGILFNYFPPRWRTHLVAAFSPLFIGEYSSTIRSMDGRSSLSTFQSPLHRGILFNNVNDERLTLACSLSVPSSSGNTLQQCGRGSTVQKVRLSFSPLFIGEYSSTPRATRRYRARPDFQSPLHRGILFNHAEFTVYCRQDVAFSPLFIGEYSSTRIVKFHTLGTIAFSPLFIGEYSSTLLVFLPPQP